VCHKERVIVHDQNKHGVVKTRLKSRVSQLGEYPHYSNQQKEKKNLSFIRLRILHKLLAGLVPVLAAEDQGSDASSHSDA
jgi:hypothetical protein